MGDQEWSVVLWYMISIAQITATRSIVLLGGFFGTYSYWMVKLGFLFLFWHCALPLSLGVVECWEWDLFKFMKSVIPPTHLKKEDTFIDNENVIEYFIHMYTVDKAGLSHMSRWQSVSLVLWVKRHNLLNNRALQINIPLKKTRGQWCYYELCPVGIKIWPCPQIWSYFHKCI